MLGLGERAVFEFHLANWLSQGDEGLPIAPELQRMSNVRALCVYNEDGDESSCPDAASSTPEELGKFLSSEVAKIGKIAKDVGAKID